VTKQTRRHAERGLGFGVAVWGANMATHMENLICIVVGLLVGCHIKDRETHPRKVAQILLRLCDKPYRQE